MVIMENFYSPHNRFYELWQEIEKCHLSYLELEESPEKIDQRNKLEEYIHDFLCVAAHSQKFAFQETEEVLQRSASNKKDFSGYKAATGFNAIQLYAGNLLAQPWRKEYRQIKTYCGFYKHQIEGNLVGAEMMFEAMGYKHYSDGVLELDGPLCPDRVAAVSRDCLIAYVECQIMKAIWEELSTSFKISWLEVLEFRKSHLGGTEQAIKALGYRHHQKQYQEHSRSYPQSSDPYILRCPPVTASSTSPVLPVNHSFPPLSGMSNHHHVGLPPAPQTMPQYVYANGCCANNYPACGAYAYMPYTQPMMKPNVNGYYFSNGYHTPTMSTPNYHHYSVPTGPLIDLEPHNGGYDVVDRPSHKSHHIEHINNDLYRIRNNSEVKLNTFNKEDDKDDSQFEDWDYVYRNLESQGYSKDLGERGDVLSPNSQKAPRDTRTIKETNLDEALNNLMITDGPLKVGDAIKRLEQEKRTSPESIRVVRQTSPSSSYDNLTSNDMVKKPALKTTKTASYAKTKSLPREKAQTSCDKQLPNSKTLDMRKSKEEKGTKGKEHNLSETSQPPSSWQCKACTFLNDPSKDICEMCSKSRTTTVEQPMEIGGAECSKCTLVNPKNLKICEACGTSLKGSPTYI